MSETRFDIQVPRAGGGPAETPVHGRQPFVTPTVEDLGGLAKLTLLGGSL
jgi:hypothetical protein